ncbi:MAG: VOC family protein, partial [Candidatus Obscuribacterales bacterium]|nr:VOC family protein [Candidatus Obscuribacterales bacterium]
VDEQQRNELKGLAEKAVETQDQAESQNFYRQIVDTLSRICNKSQKEMAAELQNLSKELESQGKVSEAFEFKQRTCAVLLELSMEERRLTRIAQADAKAEPDLNKAEASYLEAPKQEVSHNHRYDPGSDPEPQNHLPEPTNASRVKIIGAAKESHSTAASFDSHKHKLPFARLAYLYMGSTDFESTVAYYTDVLGGEKVWNFDRFGLRVTAFMLSHGPLVLISDHRKNPSCQPVFEVDDLKETARQLTERGWKAMSGPFGTPNGEAIGFQDPSGNSLAIFEADPTSTDRSYFDPTSHED